MDDFKCSTLKDIFDLIDQAEQQEKDIKWLVKTLIDFKDYYVEVKELWKKKVSELSSQNDELKKQVSDFECRLNVAHKRLEEKLSAVINERDTLLHQLNTVKYILSCDSNIVHKENKEKLSFLYNAEDNYDNDKLGTGIELDNTRLIDDDPSFDKLSPQRSHLNRTPPTRYFSEDNLDASTPKKSKGKNSTSYIVDLSKQSATTSVTEPLDEPVTAISNIEPKPSTSREPTFLERRLATAPPRILINAGSDETSAVTPKRPFSCRSNITHHNWIEKSLMLGQTCAVCSKNIRFDVSMMIYKCSNCKAVVHAHCKENVPVPCVPVCINTPNVNTCKAGFINDFVPATSPMVPSLVVHCTREIEARGFSEVELYLIPGTDKEVKTLKEKLIRAHGVIDLSGIPDIHVVCGCLKEFFKSLKEPLIPESKWKPLGLASETQNREKKKNKFDQIIQDLPQANRDTLAHIVLHLQKVSAAPNCKMPVSNLSKIFGPIIVGYSDYNSQNMLSETNIINKIMAELILLPDDFWEQWLNPMILAKSSSIKTVRKYNFFQTP